MPTSQSELLDCLVSDAYVNGLVVTSGGGSTTYVNGATVPGDKADIIIELNNVVSTDNVSLIIDGTEVTLAPLETADLQAGQLKVEEFSLAQYNIGDTNELNIAVKV